DSARTRGDAHVLRLPRMFAADVDADAGKNLGVAGDEMQTAGEIGLQQDVDVVRLDATVFPAGLPRIAGVVRVLVLLNPDLRLREEVRPVSVVPMSVREHNVRDLLRLHAEWRDGLVGPYEVIDLPVFEKL